MLKKRARTCVFSNGYVSTESQGDDPGYLKRYVAPSYAESQGNDSCGNHSRHKAVFYNICQKTYIHIWMVPWIGIYHLVACFGVKRVCYRNPGSGYYCARIRNNRASGRYLCYQEAKVGSCARRCHPVYTDSGSHGCPGHHIRLFR